jgi:hypothetical protein
MKIKQKYNQVTYTFKWKQNAMKNLILSNKPKMQNYIM